MFQIPVESQTLKKPDSESKTKWVTLDDPNLTLSDYGFKTKNAEPDQPAILALVLPGN